jgi:AcrR family transcriptional regulator
MASEELGERILDVATHQFLSHGYGATSIESVARRARVSKRTFYHRFENKPALFAAVVHRIIDRLRPPADTPLLKGAGIEQVLLGLATLILRAALSPNAIALHRLIVAESARFPILAAAVAEEGSTAEAINLIAGLLARETRTGSIAADHPSFAAQQFLHMVIAVPQRRAMGLGRAMAPAEVERWARDVVALFLNGCARRNARRA